MNAARPSQVPGSRIDPPMSVPTLRGAYPAAAAAPAPDDDPPVVSAGSQGLRVMPCRLETPDESIPQSGMTVDPTITAPASVSRSTTGELRSGTTGTTPALPAGMGTPARARFSLTVAGTPSSGPAGLTAPPAFGALPRGDPGRLVGAVPQGVELGLGVVHDGQRGLHHLGGGEAAVGVCSGELGAR